MNHITFRSLVLVTIATLAAAGCARNTGEAGVKPIGVGFDPGDIFAAPEAKGGVIDFTLARLRGHALDLGITGFFGSAGAFVDPEEEPFDSTLGFGYLFSPAITAADEYGLISPKGPDVPDACFVQINTRGPLGSFRTVDVGERITLRSVDSADGDDDDSAGGFMQDSLLTLSRDPQDYPINTTNVFLLYSGFDNFRESTDFLPGNWTFGSEMELHFDGGLPPGGAPVASIPLSSEQEDPRVGKPAGDPRIWSADELTNVFVSNQEDGADAELMRYAPTTDGLPSPLLNDGVINVTWDAAENQPDRSLVTISLKLLGTDDEGSTLDDGQSCVPAEPFEPGDGVKDLSWQIEYNDIKKRWCDPDFEPDVTVGNVEGGDFFDENGVADTEDTCHDGIDQDGNGRCDEGGCFDADGNWLDPDPTCARHTFQTSACGSDGLCRATGGSRSGDGTLGELICSAEDTGQFTVPADEIEDLLSQVDASAAEGAVVIVARTSDTDITVPMVRDPVGNQDDINPVRVRTSQVHYGRLAWEAPAADEEE